MANDVRPESMYVFEFTQPAKESGSCKLSFRRGVGSRVRFVRVRLDRMA